MWRAAPSSGVQIAVGEEPRSRQNHQLGRQLPLALQAVRLITEPDVAALAAARATGKDGQRIHATGLPRTRRPNLQSWWPRMAPELQGVRGAIDTSPNVVLGSASIASRAGSRTFSPAMPATALAIEEGDAERNRSVMQQVLGFNRSKLSCRKAGAGRRNGWPGGSRSLGKK